MNQLIKIKKNIFSYTPFLASLLLLQGCITTPNESEMNALFRQQNQLVETQKAQLLPERTEQTDLYFVGFGADYSQNVFKKEVFYAQNLFDQRFNTQGRSTLLINNNATDQSLPLANYLNLKKTLKYVGETMDVEEDVLFLFLTGHGKKDEGLFVNYGPQQQAFLSPSLLNIALEKSNIKWKVIVVSACFSGIYTDVLADEHTLVMTASNSTQPSFGCSNMNDFTYFGEAYFKSQLQQHSSFVEAFYQAKDEISDKEKMYGLEPSKPQIAVADKILNKLTELTVNEG